MDSHLALLKEEIYYYEMFKVVYSQYLPNKIEDPKIIALAKMVFGSFNSHGIFLDRNGNYSIKTKEGIVPIVESAFLDLL